MAQSYIYVETVMCEPLKIVRLRLVVEAAMENTTCHWYPSYAA